jgi:hypothetical protein
MSHLLTSTKNPTISAACDNLTIGKAYCVVALSEPAPAPSPNPVSSSRSSSAAAVSSTLVTTTTSKPVVVPITSTPTSTMPSVTTSTSVGNGISTPLPTQPGKITNCAKFHWIAKGVTCNQVYSYQKISLADFVRWNPTVKDDCSGMWAEVQVCVGVIGGGASPTPTSNAIQTPQPTQPGMVSGYQKFHYVAEGIVCSQIISYQKITLADFIRWNTGIKSDCSNMWSGAHVCVGV